MATYLIGWQMSGEVEIEATSRDEAVQKFWRKDTAEIATTCADDGLIPDEPETAEERAAKWAKRQREMDEEIETYRAHDRELFGGPHG